MPPLDALATTAASKPHDRCGCVEGVDRLHQHLTRDERHREPREVPKHRVEQCVELARPHDRVRNAAHGHDLLRGKLVLVVRHPHAVDPDDRHVDDVGHRRGSCGIDKALRPRDVRPGWVHQQIPRAGFAAGEAAEGRRVDDRSRRRRPRPRPRFRRRCADHHGTKRHRRPSAHGGSAPGGRIPRRRAPAQDAAQESRPLPLGEPSSALQLYPAGPPRRSGEATAARVPSCIQPRSVPGGTRRRRTTTAGCRGLDRSRRPRRGRRRPPGRVP